MKSVMAFLVAAMIVSVPGPVRAAAIDLGPCLIPPPASVSVQLDRAVVVAGDAALVSVIRPTASVPVSAVVCTPWQQVALLAEPRGLSAWVPVPLGASPGQHLFTVQVTLDDGRRSVLQVPMIVSERDAPVQHLAATSTMVALTSDSQRIALDRAAIRSAYRVTADHSLWSGPFLTPTVGRISTEFGVSRLTNGRLTGYHYGIDIAAPTGTPVLAAHSGRIVLAADLLLQGKTVIIDHGRGLHSLYYHLSTISVTVDDKVSQGDVVGEVGSTGYSTGPHLHWGMSAGAVAIDPVPFVAGERSSDSPAFPFSDRL